MAPHVVISGIGVVSAIGIGRDTFWRHLLEGRSGVRPVTSFDTSAYPVHNGAEVPDFNGASHVRRLRAEAMGRASQFAIAAARLALDDAGLDAEVAGAAYGSRVGVVVGTTSGEPHIIEALDDALVAGRPDRVDQGFVRKYPSHMLAAHVAAEFGFRGVAVTVPIACAAGNGALAYAWDAIRSGAADLVLAGGADAFSRITFTGFARLGAIAPERCQPFDRGRRGMIPGEGAAMLLLESGEHARARGARVYAQIGGYGWSCDAHHMTAGHPAADGATRAMQMALESADLEPEDVSYISAHGTGTTVNDRLETLAIKRVFGRAAYAVPVSSIKSMLGHAMGAASAIEAAACALAVATDRVPPTMNLDDPDPACDLDYVPNTAREHRVEVAMNNAYAFGGNNSCLIVRRCEAAA
ncbi:MAG: beta-ketoacyl-[acyl-carrier-protein] synthase family protein [Acidobacteria bacterium]|nr:beta-ketoacyl-[acyl-carrier-protein] synthase family protein [Acidobacteriota bacterium]